ncbi:MAG TPA: molybdenum cofactor guanylyltransferase [Dehalococcoidia bacterium]|nr:molybdenum cofactor guanylyltransferase [Dehalococcoidia bacterium]
MAAAFSGIVLAGGLSKRLGTDKTLLEFGGKTLLGLTVERLIKTTSDIVIACGAGPRPGWPDMPVEYAADRHTSRGPLAGLDAGLRAIGNPGAIVVACDMPFLNPGLLRYMATLLDGHDAVVPVVGGRRHALHAAYSRACLPFIKDLLVTGGSMGDLLSRVDTCDVHESDVRRMDPDGLSCFNLNSPRDLRLARELWARQTLPA